MCVKEDEIVSKVLNLNRKDHEEITQGPQKSQMQHFNFAFCDYFSHFAVKKDF